MNVSSLLTAHDRFLGGLPHQQQHHQSPPLVALHQMMETKIPRGPSPPAAALPSSALHAARSYQHHMSSSSTPHGIHNILGGRIPPAACLHDVAAGFAAAAAAAAAAGLVVDRAGPGAVCQPGPEPGYPVGALPRPACSAAAPGRTLSCGGPTTSTSLLSTSSSSFWSQRHQAGVKSAAASPSAVTADWNHSVTGASVHACICSNARDRDKLADK